VNTQWILALRSRQVDQLYQQYGELGPRTVGNHSFNFRDKLNGRFYGLAGTGFSMDPGAPPGQVFDGQLLGKKVQRGMNPDQMTRTLTDLVQQR